VAHEINNPLEAITNLLYLSRTRAVDPELQGWLQQADIELRRVAVIANQTLRFHKQASKPRAITCLELLSATLTAHEGRLRNVGITVEKRKRANEPFVCFEADVRHVLSNIVSNAIDAMPNGGRLLVRSRLGTNWRTKQRGLIVTLADTRTGMAQYTQGRISKQPDEVGLKCLGEDRHSAARRHGGTTSGDRSWSYPYRIHRSRLTAGLTADKTPQ
jgi:signal transduction histidine kinase